MARHSASCCTNTERHCARHAAYAAVVHNAPWCPPSMICSFRDRRMGTTIGSSRATDARCSRGCVMLAQMARCAVQCARIRPPSCGKKRAAGKAGSDPAGLRAALGNNAQYRSGREAPGRRALQTATGLHRSAGINHATAVCASDYTFV